MRAGVDRLQAVSSRPGAEQEFRISAGELAKIVHEPDVPRQPLIPPNQTPE
jgi:hypothetical protein